MDLYHLLKLPEILCDGQIPGECGTRWRPATPGSFKEVKVAQEHCTLEAVQESIHQSPQTTCGVEGLLSANCAKGQKFTYMKIPKNSSVKHGQVHSGIKHLSHKFLQKSKEVAKKLKKFTRSLVIGKKKDSEQNKSKRTLVSQGTQKTQEIDQCFKRRKVKCFSRTYLRSFKEYETGNELDQEYGHIIGCQPSKDEQSQDEERRILVSPYLWTLNIHCKLGYLVLVLDSGPTHAAFDSAGFRLSHASGRIAT